jgi:hypothetical protein
VPANPVVEHSPAPSGDATGAGLFLGAGVHDEPRDLPTRRSPGPPQVRKSSTSRPVGGRLPDLNVRKSSGSRPPTGRLPDGFRTLAVTIESYGPSSDMHFAHAKHATFIIGLTADLCPSMSGTVAVINGNVRKPSGSRPPTGRLPDGFRTLRSGSRPLGGREVDDFRTWEGPGNLRVGRSRSHSPGADGKPSVQ